MIKKYCCLDSFIILHNYVCNFTINMARVGNNMISSAIRSSQARVNFSKTTKLHEPVGLVQFVVFEKFISAYLQQIALEIILLLVYNIQKKRITDSQDRRHLAARAPFVICTHVATSHSFSANHTRVLFPCISITA